jgi:hypothetical protein
MDDIHDHPAVQGLLKWQSRHHWLIAALALAVAGLSAALVYDLLFMPRSVF